MKALLILCCAALAYGSLSAQEKNKWGYWTEWGQVDEKRYVNPIIPSDYSDIDCIRVGDDYYVISSTFQFSPGMTVLHSKDLVNWEICGNAVADLTQIGPELGWSRMGRYTAAYGPARCVTMPDASISFSERRTKVFS